jgi:hypothetical protein
MLTGRNPLSVGAGSLANFDSGYPGYRGKSDTIAGILRVHGWRNCNVDGGIIPDWAGARVTCRSADISLGL